MPRAYFDMRYDRMAVQRVADALRLDTQDLRTMQDAIDAAFRKHEEQLFVSEGASGGEKWSSLSPYYSAFKKAEGGRVRRRNKATVGVSKERPVSQKILRWSENMMRSLTRSGHSEHVSEVTTAGPSFTVGTVNELAHYHYTGRTTPNYMPSRNPVAHTDDQKQAYLEVIRAYVVKKADAIMRSLAGVRARRTGR